MNAPQKSAWLDSAFKLTALAMPVVLAVGGWMVTKIVDSERRISVLEEMRKERVQILDRELAEIKGMIRDMGSDMGSRLLKIEARLNSKEE